MSPLRTHLDKPYELVGGPVLEDEVAHRRAVAGHVAERPDALLAHVDARRRQQAGEQELRSMEPCLTHHSSRTF